MTFPANSHDHQRRRAGHFKAKGLKKASSQVIAEARTVYPATVVAAEDSPRLLVSGHNNSKIGRQIEFGRWANMPVFTLTLEERATCPNYCHHFETCYGNSVHRARRHKHGLVFEYLLEREIAKAQHDYPNGFVIRVHVLGDFYSVKYVQLWEHLLKTFPGLHVFGYTARDPDKDAIGAAVFQLAKKHWDRFAIRQSVPLRIPFPKTTLPTAMTAPAGDPIPNGAFWCPAQTEDAKCCANCCACWESPKNVVFAQHGAIKEKRHATPSRSKTKA